MQDHVIVIGAEPRSLINFRKDLLLELVTRGHKVTAVATGFTNDQILALQEIGVATRSVTFSRSSLNPLYDLRSTIQLRRLFKELRPAIVISYTIKPIVYGSLAARLAEVPKVCAMVTGLGYSFIEGNELKRRIARLAAKLLYRLALKRASAIVFQNPDDLATFRRLGLVPTNAKVGIVNGSGVDLDYFKVCDLPSRPVFLMVARLLADKGTREYANAAERLRKKYPTARTLLAGGFDASPNSVSEQELNTWINGGLEYLGELSDVRSAIEKASVIVLPSYREGTPRAVLEGMAMGRAIVTTDVPGCRETVQHGMNGFLVPPRDSIALFGAMEKFQVDPGLVHKMGLQSLGIVRKKYDAKLVARSTLDLMEAEGTENNDFH